MEVISVADIENRLFMLKQEGDQQKLDDFRKHKLYSKLVNPK